ncbi:hypothetical protein CLCR_07212 [Cladophialophora carrionii]|uniref:F-box domain-containing protein n=1 Tax=Cladophialophora carrionii TaxID=86049 RepID=A0A1C1CMN7_9EURO|nr:hypothetical protein CLCR_07212 [Cladophialophora carrionii]
MAPTDISRPTSFTDLPDDCILILIEELAEFHNWYHPLPQDVKNLSLVSKRLRHLCEPALFKDYYGHVVMPRIGDRADAGILSGLSGSTFFSSRLHAFEITLLQNDHPGFYNSFVMAIKAMTDLFQLKVNLCNNAVVASHLQTELERTETILPTVGVLHLTTAPDSVALLLACPHLTTLVAEDLTLGWKSALRAIPTLQCLRHLEVRKNLTNWTARSIQVLSITSTQWHKQTSATESCDDMDPEERWAYMLRKDDKRHTTEDPAEVAQRFFAICPRLMVLRVLQRRWSEKYLCKRETDGKVQAIHHVESGDNWAGYPSSFSSTPWTIGHGMDGLLLL